MTLEFRSSHPLQFIALLRHFHDSTLAWSIAWEVLKVLSRFYLWDSVSVTVASTSLSLCLFMSFIFSFFIISSLTFWGYDEIIKVRFANEFRGKTYLKEVELAASCCSQFLYAYFQVQSTMRYYESLTHGHKSLKTYHRFYWLNSFTWFNE